jgi:hypothetical protein
LLKKRCSLLELFAAFVVVAALGAVGGSVAAFTHQAFLNKFLATAKADIHAELEAVHDKLESLKARL